MMDMQEETARQLALEKAVGRAGQAKTEAVIEEAEKFYDFLYPPGRPEEGDKN